MMDFVQMLSTIAPSYVDVDSGNVIISDQYSTAMSDSDMASNASRSLADIDDILYVFSPDTLINSTTMLADVTNDTIKNEAGYRDPLTIILPISVCYFIIFVAGVLGNLITCIVIAKNKTMHTATNYYLFNLAVSDFLVLIFGKFLLHHRHSWTMEIGKVF